MARLIPRKQIEEQQNITGSLTIGENLYVTNDSIISGSLFVSKSFFFGNDTGSLNEITGSVFLTGSLTIDGNLRVGAPETILSITSSNTILAEDTQRYAGILAKDFGANVPTLYVSSTDGDDNNDGRSIQYPLRTIKRAAALASPGYDGRYGFDTGSIYNGYVIKVQAGTYLEDNPVILPKNTTIWGAGLRITKINAKNPEQDLFWVNSGCYIAEVTMGGLRLWPSEKEPERGFGVAFQPGAFITTSPYVQNCSQISNQENSFTELYEEIPPGGGGLYVNGDVIDPDSPLASMVLDAYTQISPNGVGCLVNGRGFIQLVSFFNNFSYYAIRVNNGGHATLNNSNISFGLYGMYASGSRFISGSGGNIDARDRVRASWSVVVDVLNRGLDALPEVTTLNTAEGIRLSSPSQYPQYTTSSAVELSTTAADEISSDYKLISAIVENGNSNFPTLLARSSNKGFSADSPYNILGADQITGSLSGSLTPLSASLEDLSQISSSFGVILGIFSNGTGSYDFKSSTSASIKRTSYEAQPASPALSNDITSSISSSFESIISIIKNGLSAVPAVTSSTSASLYIGAIEPVQSGISSSQSVINNVSASFSIIYNILSNGTGSNILPIPNDHKRAYTITNNNSSSYQWEGVGANPTITLFRGETYKFYISASEAIGGIDYPFWIRTQPVETIDNTYDYDKGVINNGDSVGNITFAVPYDAPNTLYYTSQTNNTLSGRFNIINNSATPRELIANTLTYPATISGSIASEDVDIINAFEILTGSKAFIQEEVIQYVSSSWSGVDGFTYNEAKCRRDVGFLIDAVAQDLLYGGNDRSITAGRFYYEYPSEATTTQKEPTKTAVKYAAKLVQQLLKNVQFRSIALNTYTQKRFNAWEVINDNKSFVQNETIAFLSSSWSNFSYNETKCKRDVGYILDAVATDILYGGNERAIEAGEFYYRYPSNATLEGDGDSIGQLGQTLDGIRFAAGMVNKLIAGKQFSLPTTSSQAAYSLIRDNKSLIQNEVIQYVNVAYPQLKYNTDKCRRDVGYILDAVATDLIYGGNERSVTAGKYYYDYPSVATSIQKKETSGAIRYAKIITDYIVKNIILDTPRIVNNDERNIKVTNFTNVTSSFSGTQTQQSAISSSFAIMEGIIKRGLSAIPSILAQNTGLNWGKDNPLNVTSGSQTTSSFVTPVEVNKIASGFNIVNTIIAGGIAAEPVFTSSQTNAIKVTSIPQYVGVNAASGSLSSSLSASISLIGTIVTKGTGSIPSFVSNTLSNIKVTSTSIETLAVSATNVESQSISSSMKLITDVLVGGKSVLPALTSSLSQNIKVTSTEQYISSSYSGSLEDVSFISSSISIVTKIIERGESAGVFGKANYTSSLSSSNALAAYNIIKQNIDFIQDETIAYLSSSWSSFQYDEAKCRRDVGLIISGAAEDLIWNQNSASVVNGQFYYEYPSQATGSQLAQTLDGINYASRLTQKLIQNIQFQQFTGSRASASLLILNNKDFIADETIAYMSSSWGSFDYNETTCRRDIGYILDAVRTDIIYGGNERTRIAADYYFTYPSAATGSQLIQTTDAINYASRIAQKVVVGQSFTQASLNSINASELIRKNKELIAAEVVEYVSSSWSGVLYNEDKCKRDVGYILDAVRTDLVYGGNERSIVAGDFYYRYPSSATVGGVPSSTQQLDPTITGIYYANQLVQNIIKKVVLTNPSSAVLSARELVKENRTFIQQNTIDYVNDTYPSLNYKEDKCYRDTGFIIDNVLTDLVYGGNERAITAGRFYYLYPSQATDAQVTETVDAIEFARDLAELVAIGGKPIEDGFDIVSEIIASGSSTAPTLVSNTEDGIRKSSELQFLVKDIVTINDKTIVSSSFGNVINIVDKGVGAIPTIISSSLKGVARIAGSQITSSVSVDTLDKTNVSDNFDTILDIVENGLGSIPTITLNTLQSIKVTNTPQYITSSYVATTNEAAIISSSFGIVMDIIANGSGSIITQLPTSSYSSATSASNAFYAYNLLKQNVDFIKDETIAYLSSSWSTASYDEAKCRRDVGLIISGAAEDLLFNSVSASFVNGKFYLEYPSQAQGAQLSQTLDGIRHASRLAQKIVQSFTFVTASQSRTSAYNLLLDNKNWIQNQTIAKINSNLWTSTYNEETCKRDVGYIIDNVATDVLWGGNERSVEAGKYYYLFPSQATGSQLAQTLEGIGYVKSFVSTILSNELVYNQYTSSEEPLPSDSSKAGIGFDIVIDIIGNGTGSIPTLVNNASGLIKRSNYPQFVSTASISSTYISSSKNNFDVILDIVENGTGSLPTLVKNVNGLFKITNQNQYTASVAVSKSLANNISSSFNKVINILENGIGSLPTLVTNTNNNIKVTTATQYISASSATTTQVNAISASISIVTNIIANGTGSILTNLPTSSYNVSVSSSVVLAAYGILKNNISFIQDETIAYLSSSWSTASYDEAKCRRDIGLIISGAAEDLIWNSNSSSVVNGKFYYEYPSQAQGAQLNQTLDGVIYASRLAQKVILNTPFVLPTSQSLVAYDILVNNKTFIQEETIAYLSSSWASHSYNETTCKRDVGYIIDAVATDVKWGGNERTIKAGSYYYLYPSAATGSQIQETVTGIGYARDLADKLLRGYTFSKVSQNKLQAKELIFKNKGFIADEVIAYVSASWSTASYNQETCKRDVGYILDAIATDIVYGGNERSLEAGEFYYRYPSQATTSQLGPTLSGIKHAKNMVEQVLNNRTFTTASNSVQTAYELIYNNKDLIQTETIGFLNSAWSFFEYNEAKCRRDVGYILDAVATDILYGGNERVREAGEYYYLYPSLATVDGDGDALGQLGQTLDGVRYAKGLVEKIVRNTLLSKPTKSELAGWDLLNKNKKLIQKETIAFLSSSWSGIGGFSYNEASCSRDVAYIVDNVATDLVYGGNERSSKAGEYYYLYPSAATVTGSISPTTTSQKGPTIDGIQFAAGVAQNVISKKILVEPTEYVKSAYSLMKQNRTFIQNETIQFIDAFYPYLRYNREKCRRDVGYIVDNVATDLWYGGNQRSIIAGDYYYRYPSKATKVDQVIETVAGVEYAKALTKKIVQNVQLSAPTSTSNTTSNIKVGLINQYTSSISATTSEVNKVSSSFSIVTKAIEGGLTKLPTIVSNNDGLIKISNEIIVSSSVSASSVEVGIVTASFGLIRDIIYWGSASVPDSLANNYNYGFELSVPKLLHISSVTQSLGSGTYNSQTSSVSSSFGNIINIINNGTGSIPSLVTNTSGSIKTTAATLVSITGSSSEVNRIGNLFGVILNIVENGKSVIPTLVSNTSASIKVTSTPQIISGSGADRLQAKLISSSFSYVIDMLSYGTSSVTYEAPSLTPNTNAKINAAYNLLLNNKQMIVDETIAFMSSSWSTFVYNEASCSRDVALIVSGAAYDLLYGGNSASFVNGKFYFEYPSAATGSQLDQTITALKFASGLAEKVVKNQLLTHISSSFISSSWASLRTNKQFIQSESIAYLSSSWQGFDYNETTCKRDIGYIIDAVATDILYGGNERSIIAGRYYYDYPSQATSAQLEPTLTGVRYARGLAMNIVSGSTFVSPSVNNQTAYNLIKNNKTFIQEETVAFVNAKYPELDYIESKCRRDVGYIVDAVATDLLYGGNERSNKAGEFYYLYPSLATENEQVVETTTAVDYARRLTQEIINSNLIAEPQIVLNTFNNIKVTNIPQYVSASSATTYEVNRVSSSFAIVTNIVENGLGVTPTLVANTSQSIKFTTTNQYLSSSYGTSYEASLLSASISIVTNIISGGLGVAGSPVNYTTPSTASNVWYAYNLLKQNIGFIQNETIAYISSSWSTASYDESKCKRDVGLIISGAAEDMLFGVDSASIVNGKFYFESASQATTSQLNFTLDGIFFASKLAQNILQNVEYVTASLQRRTAWELLNYNKSFIQNETIAYISSSWVTGSNTDSAFVYDESKCKRDVGYILDAVATDVYYGGNERTLTAGRYYFLYPSSATGSQLDETLDGIRYAGQLAQKVIVNTLFVTASAHASASYALMKQNKPFIQAEVLSYITSSWNEFTYSLDKCRRDVGLIIDAVATDTLYGGNERSAKAGTYYYLYSSKATGSQLEQTVDAIDYAGGLVKNIIQNKTFVTASQIISASVELLRNNRAFIQEETMQYLTSSWANFEYNKEKCRRDVGYIIDGVATDLLYGGNERSVMSGEFYYRYPSKATLLGDGDGVGQLKQTNDGINYASRIAQKVIQNIVFNTASLAVSASVYLLRENKNFIAAEAIAYVSSSWSGVRYNEASCSRDVKYLIDAAATDLLYGGQERSITAGTFYYLFPSRATNAGVPSEQNQLDPTITGVRYAGKLATKSVTNPTYVDAWVVSGSLMRTAQLLTFNKTLIQKETITFLSSSWATLKYNEVSCSRDLGFIIDAIRTDLVYGGNERSIEAGSYYYRIPSVAIAESYTDNGEVGQKKQTVDGINFARGISEKLVANTQLTYLAPTLKRRQAAVRLVAAKEELKQRAIGYTNGAFPYLVYNEASCSRDTGLIVDACATDLLYGGNERAIAAASSYWNAQYGSAQAVVSSQKLETLETNRYLRTRAEFIAAGAPLESFGSLIVATGIDYSYNGSGVTFKALPPNQGGSGAANPIYEITELGGGRIFFTSGNQDGDFRIGTGLSINQATGTLVGRTFSKSLFSLVTPFSLALQI